MSSLTSINVAVTKKMTEIDYWKSFHEKLEEFIDRHNNEKSNKDGVTGVNTVNVKIGDIIGRDPEASSLWEFIKYKKESLAQCNIMRGSGRVLDMEVNICVARDNRSKVPLHLRTTPRSPSYNIVNHKQESVHKKVQPIFDPFLKEIEMIAGSNSELKEKMMLDLRDRFDAQLPDAMRRNNEINSSIVSSLKEFVIGITTNGTRDAFDQTFVNNLAIACFPSNGSLSMSEVARAIGGNRKTMSRVFKMKPSLIKQYNVDNEDEDTNDLDQMIDRIEEERFLRGEFLYNNEFELENEIIDNIGDSDADENEEGMSCAAVINDGADSNSMDTATAAYGDENDDDQYDLLVEEDYVDSADPFSLFDAPPSDTADGQGVKRKRVKRIRYIYTALGGLRNKKKNVGHSIVVNTIIDYWHSACPEDTMTDRSVCVGGTKELKELHKTGQQTKSTKQLYLDFFGSSFFEQFKRDNDDRKNIGKIGFGLFQKCKCPCIKFSQWHNCVDVKTIAVEQCLISFTKVAKDIISQSGSIEQHQKNCKYCEENPTFLEIKHSTDLVNFTVCPKVRIPSLDRPDKGNFHEKEQQSLHQMNEKMISRGQKVEVGKLYKKEGMPKSFDEGGMANFHARECFSGECEACQFYEEIAACKCIGFISPDNANVSINYKKHDRESKTSSDRIIKNRFQSHTTTRIDFLREFSTIMKAWGPHHWHKVWNNWQRRLLFDQGPKFEKETGQLLLLFHIDFANTWAMKQQSSICCEQPPNIYQIVVVVSTNPRYNNTGQLLYDNEVFSFWAEKSTDEVEKDYYLVQKCVKKVLDTYDERKKKSNPDNIDKKWFVVQLSDQCAGEFKSKNTAWSAATLINECENIAHAINCQAPSTAFKCCADGAGFNNMSYCEKLIRGGEAIVNEGVDVLKLLMARPQPTKLDDDNPKRRMMTESGKTSFYVVDKRLKNNYEKEKQEVKDQIMYTDRRNEIWLGANPLPMAVHQMSSDKDTTAHKLVDKDKEVTLQVQDYECFCGVCMGITTESNKPERKSCPNKLITIQSNYVAKRIDFKPSSGEKSKDPYVFLGKGAKLDRDNFPVIAIETKPDTIRYAIMLQAPNKSSAKARDNIKCPLDGDQNYCIAAKTDYVKVHWLQEMENSMSDFKRFKPCDQVGNTDTERKENHLFPADRIYIPSDFSTSSDYAALVASGNTFQRLNYLGITEKTDVSSSLGYSFDQDVNQMDLQNLITVRKYVSQGMICDDIDLENVEEDMLS